MAKFMFSCLGIKKATALWLDGILLVLVTRKYRIQTLIEWAVKEKMRTTNESIYKRYVYIVVVPLRYEVEAKCLKD